MFGIGGGELAILALFALLLFGPDKVPQLARTVGKFMREFNKYKDTMETTLRAEMFNIDTPAESSSATEPTTSTPAATPAGWASDEEDEEDEE